MSETDPDVSVRINLYPEDSEVKAVRQIGLGVQPFVLLEAQPGEDGGVVLAVVGSLVDDLDELVETLEGFTEAVRAAVEQVSGAEAYAGE